MNDDTSQSPGESNHPSSQERQSAVPEGLRQHKVLSFDEISAGATTVLIKHGDKYYRLSTTRAGGLVLTK